MNSSLTWNETGRYEIRSQLGMGGMGVVYLADDNQLQRRVAIRFCPQMSLLSSRMWRFDQEAKAAAALNHPNIAHVYEIGESQGMQFIAMEYIDGHTLRELIQAGQTELVKFLRYLQHTAEGLAKAHDAGIVHRDLKPDNIMITRDGREGSRFRFYEIDRTNLTPTINKARLICHAICGSILRPAPAGTVGTCARTGAGKTDQTIIAQTSFAFGCILLRL
jgi:serine/threonine protein kinase